jgi:FkbM family methyltransferase
MMNRVLPGPFARRLLEVRDLLRVRRAMRRNRRYDHQMVQVMRRHLRPDSTVIDVGAFEGKVLELLRWLAPQGRHYAFEPLPSMAAELRRRFPEVEILECALGDTNGDARYVVVRNDPAYSGLRRRIYDRPDPQLDEIRVAVRRLDDVIPEDVEVAFLKLDIEGGEYHAMRGGLRTIRRSRPIIVFEAGRSTTGCYDVTPEMLFDLVTVDLDLGLSTMDRWLRGLAPYTRPEFLEAYRSDFYYIADPTGAD